MIDTPNKLLEKLRKTKGVKSIQMVEYLKEPALVFIVKIKLLSSKNTVEKKLITECDRALPEGLHYLIIMT